MGKGDFSGGGSYWGWWSFGPGEAPPENWKSKYQPLIDKKNAERQIASLIRLRFIELTEIIDSLELELDQERRSFSRYTIRDQISCLQRERQWVEKCIHELPKISTDMKTYIDYIRGVVGNK